MPVPPTIDDGLRRRLRKDEVFDRLLQAILDGTLEPGERLRDSELQQWFGVSRTPIRLAIDRLEDLRMVESSPNRYTRVVPAAPARIPQLVDVMCALWALAVVTALERLSESEVAESRHRLRGAAQACREHQGVDATRVVEAIRHALFYFSEHSGNRLLCVIVVRLGVSLRYQASMHGLLLDTRMLEASFVELGDAVGQRDAPRASAVFEGLRGGSFVVDPAGHDGRVRDESGVAS